MSTGAPFDGGSEPGAAADAGQVRVKICGLTRREDAECAAQLGADYLGTVIVPNSPRAVTAERAREITSGLGVPLVLVSADLTVETLVRSAQTAGAAVLQLHGNETPTMVRSVREAGDWSIWKALRVQGPDDVARGVGAFHDVVDALVLDSWDPERLGGTGVRFGWEQVARAHPEPRSGLAWVVAGGLSDENVAEAIRTLSPDVVDVSSGVESSVGVKDCECVEAFIRAARGAGG